MNRNPYVRLAFVLWMTFQPTLGVLLYLALDPWIGPASIAISILSTIISFLFSWVLLMPDTDRL